MKCIICCKDCTDRKLGCHATCERYLAEKNDYISRKEEDKAKESSIIDDYKLERRRERINQQVKRYGRSYY